MTKKLHRAQQAPPEKDAEPKGAKENPKVRLERLEQELAVINRWSWRLLQQVRKAKEQVA